MKNLNSQLVSPALQHEIEPFLFMEADLLDTRQFDEWYTLLADDLRNVKPLRSYLDKVDLDGEFSSNRESAYFDAKGGVLDSRIFSSRHVYRDEIERVFNRCWLLVAPLAWLERPGDFVTSTMGETPVVAWRHASGKIRVYLNRCLASNEPLVQPERGSRQFLICPCHGWSYRTDEQGGGPVPELVARTEIFSAFVFANRDVKADPLTSSFDPFKWCWQLIERQFPGGIEVYGGDSLGTRLHCNWKLAAEAYAGDVYSDLSLTKDTREVLDLWSPLAEQDGFQIATSSGVMAVTTVQNTETRKETMTPILATLFPNVSYDSRGGALHIWHPRGEAEIDVYTYCLVGRDDPIEVKEARRRRCRLLFGPGGMLMQDYAAIWSDVTRATQHARPHKLNLQMGLGRERTSNLPGQVSDLCSEMNQRAFFAWWQAALTLPPLLMDNMLKFKLQSIRTIREIDHPYHQDFMVGSDISQSR